MTMRFPNTLIKNVFVVKEKLIKLSRDQSTDSNARHESYFRSGLPILKLSHNYRALIVRDNCHELWL